MELAIIGGGAAGMMAALTAAEWMEGTITLLERQTRLGRKLLATGNGRCNLSNLTCAPSHYHGGHPDFVRPALDAFGVTDTLAFFRQRGLLTIAEPDGKCYPYSDQANSVLDTLRLALDAAGVVVRTDWPVEAIRPGKSGGFTLTGSAGSLWADRVILTAGGAAAPKLGGTKSGYQLAKTLGHKCTRLHPSLVQLNTDPTWPKSLKGVRADAVVKLLMGQELAAEEAGQVQFTDYGVSGPVIFQLSRLAVTGAPVSGFAAPCVPRGAGGAAGTAADALSGTDLGKPADWDAPQPVGADGDPLRRPEAGRCRDGSDPKKPDRHRQEHQRFPPAGDWRPRLGTRPGHRRRPGHQPV